MKPYLDTSFFLKLYVKEEGSEEAIALLNQLGTTPLLYSRLHELELSAAIQGKVHRKEITAAEASKSLKVIDLHLRTGNLMRPQADFDAVFSRATTLARGQNPPLGSRSLDLLHVALALETQSDPFLTYDLRQRKLAQAAGLETSSS